MKKRRKKKRRRSHFAEWMIHWGLRLRVCFRSKVFYFCWPFFHWLWLLILSPLFTCSGSDIIHSLTQNLCLEQESEEDVRTFIRRHEVTLCVWRRKFLGSGRRIWSDGSAPHDARRIHRTVQAVGSGVDDWTESIVELRRLKQSTRRGREKSEKLIYSIASERQEERKNVTWCTILSYSRTHHIHRYIFTH